MELTTVARALKRHWIVVALTFLVVVGIGIAASYYSPNRYKATAVVLVGLDPSNPQVQVQVVNFVVPALIARADSRTFRERALGNLSAEIREADVDVTTVDTDGTGVLAVTATSTRAGAVAPWATAYAEELAREQLGEGYITIGVLDAAQRPSSPYAPNRSAILVSSFLLGLIASVLAAIAAAALRGRADEADEIRSRFGTTVLGEIPSMRALHSHGIDVLFDGEAPHEVVEALQSLRTNVEFLLHDRKPRAVAVVSAASGEGKSTVAAALGWALASVGVEVTMVDADMRRPRLHAYLHGRLSPGVAQADTRGVSLLRQDTRLPSLKLIPAGLADRHPAEVLRTNLPVILDSLAAEDETIVIDCPPFEGFAETGLVTAMATSVILVIDRRRRDLVDVERSLSALEDRGAEVLGIVINRSRHKTPAGQYYFDAADQDSRISFPKARRSSSSSAS